MKRTFLERTFAGYEIQQWADNNTLTIIRVKFNRKGSIVYTMPKQ